MEFDVETADRSQTRWDTHIQYSCQQAVGKVRHFELRPTCETSGTQDGPSCPPEGKDSMSVTVPDMTAGDDDWDSDDDKLVNVHTAEPF